MTTLRIEPLSKQAFVPFGDVLDCTGDPDKIINQGFCGRYHDRAGLDFGPKGRAGISLFLAEPRDLPYTLDMVERHPDGSQAFIPMTENPFLVIVAEDKNDIPHNFRAFVSDGSQGINFKRNTWHGVLTPLHGPGRFCIIDRIGNTTNLEEYWLKTPYMVVT